MSKKKKSWEIVFSSYNRVTIPREIVEELKLKPNLTILECRLEGKKIILEPKYIIKIEKLPYE